MAQNRGLGKGLGALIPTSSEQAGYAELPVDQIATNPRQPRTAFDEEAQRELEHSIKTIGLLQPVVVRRTPAGIELVAGERRLRAARAIGLDRIPAIIRETDDDALLRDALLENLHRADLNPLEEAAAYAQLLADFACTQDELATRIGRSRPHISNTIRLLKLPPDVQRRVAAGVLSAGHARALLAIEDPAAIERLAQRIVAEGLSVRATEEVIILGDFDVADETPARRKGKKPAADNSHAALISEFTERLQDALDTRVHITMNRKTRARITIECADAEDLRRVVDVISDK